MAANSTQRWIKIVEPANTPILVNRIKGKEGVSRLFEFDVLLAAPPSSIDSLNGLLGAPFSLELNLAGGPQRNISGLVRKIQFVRSNERMIWCSAKLVPPIWALTQNRRSQVFQGMTAPKILQTIFANQNVAFHLRESYQPHAYCVQYAESDFAFASRLMEEEGIYYYFEFTGTTCQLTIADSSPQSVPLPGRAENSFAPQLEGGSSRQFTGVKEWRLSRSLTPNKVSLADHSFELSNPLATAQSSGMSELRIGSSSVPLQPGGFSALVEEFPAGYAHRFDSVGPNGQSAPQALQSIFTEGQRLAKGRAQRAQRHSAVVNGKSDCVHFTPGYMFQLAGADDNDGDYFLTSVEHDAWQPINAGEPEPTFEYRNRFRCMPTALPYRPALKTRRPKMQSLQTALVVGPTGQDIYTDQYGRVKVQFFWDSNSQSAATNSCWLRVAHGWASKGFGMVTIPRVGDEVLVGFMNGDPDQPIVVGSVYNANQPPPASLPGLSSISGFVSQTSGGDPGQSHRIIMCDQPGQELIQLHSENNFWTSAENNHSTYVKNQHTTFVGGKHRVAAGGMSLNLSPPAASGAGGSTDSSPDNPNEQYTGNVVGWEPGFGQWKNPFASFTTPGADIGTDFSNLVSDIPLLFFFKGSLELDCAGLLNTLVMGMNDATTLGFASRTLMSMTAAIESISNNGYFPTSWAPFLHSANPLSLFGLFHIYGVDAVKLGDVAANFGFTTSLAYGSRFSATHGTSWRAVGNSTAAGIGLLAACKVYQAAGTADVMMNAALPELCDLNPDDSGIADATLAASLVKPISLMVVCGMEYASFNTVVAARRLVEANQLVASKTLMPTAPTATIDGVATLVATNAGDFAATLASPEPVGAASDDLELIYGNSVCMASNISLLATPAAAAPALISICAGGILSTDAPGIVSIAASLTSTMRGGAGQVVVWGGTPDPVAPIGGNVSLLTGSKGAISLNPGTGGSIAMQNGDTPTYSVSLADGSATLTHTKSLALGISGADSAASPTPGITFTQSPVGIKIALNSGQTQTSITLNSAGIILAVGGTQLQIQKGQISLTAGDSFQIGGKDGPQLQTAQSVQITAKSAVTITAPQCNVKSS